MRGVPTSEVALMPRSAHSSPGREMSSGFDSPRRTLASAAVTKPLTMITVHTAVCRRERLMAFLSSMKSPLANPVMPCPLATSRPPSSTAMMIQAQIVEARNRPTRIVKSGTMTNASRVCSGFQVLFMSALRVDSIGWGPRLRRSSSV
jgi:hypothetical protein